MKKRSIISIFLFCVMFVSIIGVNSFAAAEPSVEDPLTLWAPVNTNNENFVTITQETDGVKFVIKGGIEAGVTNNYTDWIGDTGLGGSYIDFSKPVDLVLTVNDFYYEDDIDSLEDWAHGFTVILIFVNGKHLVFNQIIGPDYDNEGELEFTPYVQPHYEWPAEDNWEYFKPVTDVTCFWHFDLKNQIVNFGISSAPDVQPTEWINILDHNLQNIPTEDDDLVATWNGRSMLTSVPDHSITYTIHEFAGLSMVPYVAPATTTAPEATVAPTATTAPTATPGESNAAPVAIFTMMILSAAALTISMKLRRN